MSVHDRKSAINTAVREAAETAAEAKPDPVALVIAEIREIKAQATFEGKVNAIAMALGVPADIVKALAAKYGRAAIERAVDLAQAEAQGGGK